MKRILLPALALVFLAACSGDSKKNGLQKFKTDAFGSYLEISYLGEPLTSLDFVMGNFIENFNHSLSTYDSSSVISRINHNQSTQLDSLNFKLMGQGMWWTRASRGAFDITVGPLVNLWGFGTQGPHKVDSAEVDSARRLCGYGMFTSSNMQLRKLNPGSCIDYNALAPGFAADQIGQMLRQKGYENFYINVGGEILCSGVNQDSAFWLIGIEKPIPNKTGQNEAMRYIHVINQGLATSGNYRKFYMMDGKRYAHTIDPRSGYPVQHDLLSATIIAPDAVTADILATTCMVMGREEAKTFLSSLQGVEYYFIYSGEDDSFKEEWSPGMEKQFEE
ncbi:MAG: FAD:protein FMN transferase [Bacteroidetes bacterium]|nr:FAD:protein FMN transferase [Bacteroidota bacterium]